jgi:hypothetical protein
VQDHLKWHEDNLKKFSDLKAPYPGGEDIKKWTMRAYIENNAVSEGNWFFSWQAMWDRIKVALSQAIRDGVKFAASATGEVVSTVTGVPTWVWLVGGAVVVGGVGYVGYKAANTRAGAAVVGHYLGRMGR